MKSTIILVAASLALCLANAPCAAESEEAADVAGAWEITWEGRRGTATGALNLTVEDGVLAGDYTGGRGIPWPVKGSINGNEVSFTIFIKTERGPLDITFKGTVDGDSMSGTGKVRDRDIEWTAKRMENVATA